MWTVYCAAVFSRCGKSCTCWTLQRLETLTSPNKYYCGGLQVRRQTQVFHIPRLHVLVCSVTVFRTCFCVLSLDLHSSVVVGLQYWWIVFSFSAGWPGVVTGGWAVSSQHRVLLLWRCCCLCHRLRPGENHIMSIYVLRTFPAFWHQGLHIFHILLPAAKKHIPAPELLLSSQIWRDKGFTVSTGCCLYIKFRNFLTKTNVTILLSCHVQNQPQSMWFVFTSFLF